MAFAEPTEPSMPAMIDSFLPDYDFRTSHRQWVDADTDEVWAALTTVRFDELVLTRPLLRVRKLGKRIPPGSVFYDGPVTLLRVEDGRQAVGGSIAQSWSLRPRHKELSTAEEFLSFTDPGWVKFVTDFRVQPDKGGTRLSTETRIKATDSVSKRRFFLYWTGIRMFSGVVRRDVLAAVARKATAR